MTEILKKGGSGAPRSLILFALNPGLEAIPRREEGQPPVGRSEENFVSLAASQGLIESLVWVVPREEPLTTMDLIQVQQSLGGRGFSSDQFRLTLSGGIIRGEVDGLTVQFVTLPALSESGDNTVIHLSLEFFLPMFGNPVRTRSMDLLGKFLRTLEYRNLADRPVTISTLSTQEPLPAAYFFWSAALVSLFQSRDNFASGLWQGLDELLHLEFFFQSETALELVQSLMGQNPDNAALLFHRALNLARVRDFDSASADVLASAKKDPVYRYGCLELAQYMAGKGALDTARNLLDRVLEAFPDFTKAADLRSRLAPRTEGEP